MGVGAIFFFQHNEDEMGGSFDTISTDRTKSNIFSRTKAVSNGADGQMSSGPIKNDVRHWKTSEADKAGILPNTLIPASPPLPVNTF